MRKGQKCKPCLYFRIKDRKGVTKGALLQQNLKVQISFKSLNILPKWIFRIPSTGTFSTKNPHTDPFNIHTHYFLHVLCFLYVRIFVPTDSKNQWRAFSLFVTSRPLRPFHPSITSSCVLSRNIEKRRAHQQWANQLKSGEAKSQRHFGPVSTRLWFLL